MRSRTFGLIQLVVFLAHLSASPLGLAHVEWPMASCERGYRSAQTIHEAAAFAVEEKASLKGLSLTARLEVLSQEPPRPRLVERALANPQNTQTLNGFRLRVSERPPPFLA